MLIIWVQGGLTRWLVCKGVVTHVRLLAHRLPLSPLITCAIQFKYRGPENPGLRKSPKTRGTGKCKLTKSNQL